MTLSIGSSGRDFLISLVEIPVSHWSSLFRPENDADGCEVFEVTNHRSPRAIMEQCDLSLLARGAAPFLQFLRYML